MPENESHYARTDSAVFRSWQQRAAAGDRDAAEKLHRYQHRPAEELYAVTTDPYEWNNLADDRVLPASM